MTLEPNNQETDFYLWRSLERAVGRRDFDSANYWLSQLLIHRAKRKQDEGLATIEA